MTQAAYFVFHNKTVFIPIKYIYPECAILLQNHDNLDQLHCLKTDGCPANRNCMGTLAHRVNYFFDKVEPQAELMVSYYKIGESIKAGIFDRNLENPRYITCNRSAFLKFQKESIVYRWEQPTDFYLSNNVIPITQLLK